jgi:hypothetical protein
MKDGNLYPAHEGGGNMSEITHHHHPDEGPRPTVNHEHSMPYWKRAHRDWRFWIGVCFIFAAIAVYVMSVDLSLVPRSHPPSLSVGR